MFLSLGPQDEFRYNSLSQSEKDYNLYCLDFCQLILAKRPLHFESLSLIATALTNLGYNSTALRVDKLLADLKPRDPFVLYNLSCSLALMNYLEEALDSLALAIKYGYHDLDHLTYDKDLDSIRNCPRFNDIIALIS